MRAGFSASLVDSAGARSWCVDVGVDSPGAALSALRPVKKELDSGNGNLKKTLSDVSSLFRFDQHCQQRTALFLKAAPRSFKT